MHNLLQEFNVKAGAVAPVGAPALKELVHVTPEGVYDACAQKGVSVRWVLSVNRGLVLADVQYTLLSRSRNIVQDKGWVRARVC